MTTLALLALSHILQGPAPAPAREPVLDYIGRVVGKWSAVAHAGKTDFKCEFNFVWNADHRGVRGEALIAMDSPKPLHSYSMIGWDANAKAAYYVDAHDPDTLYSGHVYLEDGKLVFRFGNYGKGENEFVAKEWFVDDDHYRSEIRQAAKADGPPMISIDLTRVK